MARVGERNRKGINTFRVKSRALIFTYCKAMFNILISRREEGCGIKLVNTYNVLRVMPSTTLAQ
jgi:hypothetical protein